MRGKLSCPVLKAGRRERSLLPSYQNGLHWVFDLGFEEDRSRMRKDHSQQTFVVLRHLALNLLKQEHTTKCGIKTRRLKAGWSEDYLRKVIAA